MEAPASSDATILEMAEEKSGRRARSADPEELRAEDLAARFGEGIRMARQTRGWTQVELAEAAGLSSNYVARLERGELGASLFVAHQICSALETDIGAVLKQQGGAPRTGRRRL